MLTEIKEISESNSKEEKQNSFSDNQKPLTNSASLTIEDTSEKVTSDDKKHSWEDFSLKKETRNFEAKYIKKALLETGGRVTSAAKLLGISHQTLSQLLKQRHKNLQKMKKPRQKRSDRNKPKKEKSSSMTGNK